MDGMAACESSASSTGAVAVSFKMVISVIQVCVGEGAARRAHAAPLAALCA